MDPQTPQETAIAAVNQARAAANTARAMSVLDALDANAQHLTRFDLADEAEAVWHTFTETDLHLSDEDVATVMLRAAHYIGEERVVDLIDIHFGEHEKRITLADGACLVWMPDLECVIASYPVAGGAVDVVFGRDRVKARTA